MKATRELANALELYECLSEARINECHTRINLEYTVPVQSRGLEDRVSKCITPALDKVARQAVGDRAATVIADEQQKLLHDIIRLQAESVREVRELLQKPKAIADAVSNAVMAEFEVRSDAGEPAVQACLDAANRTKGPTAEHIKQAFDILTSQRETDEQKAEHASTVARAVVSSLAEMADELKQREVGSGIDQLYQSMENVTVKGKKVFAPGYGFASGLLREGDEYSPLIPIPPSAGEEWRPVPKTWLGHHRQCFVELFKLRRPLPKREGKPAPMGTFVTGTGAEPPPPFGVRIKTDGVIAHLGKLMDMIEQAWGIIANAGGGNWSNETAEWQLAAHDFRQKYFELIGKQKGMKAPLREVTANTIYVSGGQVVGFEGSNEGQ